MNDAPRIFDLGYPYALRHRDGRDELRFFEAAQGSFIAVQSREGRKVFRASNLLWKEDVPIYVEVSAARRKGTAEQTCGLEELMLRAHDERGEPAGAQELETTCSA